MKQNINTIQKLNLMRIKYDYLKLNIKYSPKNTLIIIITLYILPMKTYR